MASASGGGAALGAAYSRNPVDVAGQTAKRTDTFLQQREAQMEKDRLEKDAKEEKLTSLYDKKVAKIIVDQDAPPKAKEISTTAGDEIYRLTKSGLKGIELSRAVDRVTEDANAAIQGITGAAKSKANQPKDAFYRDGGFSTGSDDMMKGDYTFGYDENGRGIFQGLDGPISVKDFNGAIGTAAQIPQINSAGSVEALDTLRKSQEWDLKSAQGQNAYRNAAGEQSRANINANNGAASARYIYNNVDLGKDKEAFMAVGQKLAGGASYLDLSTEEQALFNKHIPAGQQRYSEGLTRNLADLKPSTPSTPSLDKYKNPDEYFKTTGNLLYGNNKGEGKGRTSAQAAAISQQTVEKLNGKSTGGKIDFAGGKLQIRHSGDSNYIPFDEDKNEGEMIFTPKGGDPITLAYNNDVEGESQEEVLQKYLYEDTQSAEVRSTIERFQPGQNSRGKSISTKPQPGLVKGDNYGSISTDLDLFYRKQGIDAQPTKSGVTLTKGTKTVTLDLSKYDTDEDRAIALSIQAEILSK